MKAGIISGIIFLQPVFIGWLDAVSSDANINVAARHTEAVTG
jgi:hypothetical protein